MCDGNELWEMMDEWDGFNVMHGRVRGKEDVVGFFWTRLMQVLIHSWNEIL